MRWHLEWGPQLSALLDAAAQGIPVKALANRPLLKGHLAIYHKAFTTLSRSRGAGGMGGVAAIPFSEIVCYADEYRFEGEDQRDRLIHHVQTMDLTYIEFCTTKGSDSKPDWVREKDAGADTKTKL